LDQQRAEELGLTPKTVRNEESATALDLDDGYKLYRAYYKRSRVTGGVKERTAKKYDNDIGKFIQFVKSPCDEAS